MSGFIPTQEEGLIWDYFGRSEEGYFVEVGANQPVLLSQTYNLEINGWNGILIEPQPDLAKNLKAKRKATVWNVACGSPDDKVEMELFLATDHSTLIKNTVTATTNYEKSISVKIVTLNAILKKENVKRIDFLSIDVEGFELNVLKGFNLAEYMPRLVLLEDHVLSLKLHRYMISQKYRLIRRTGLNNWYIPKHETHQLPYRDQMKLFRKMYIGTPYRSIKFKLRKRRLSKNNLPLGI